MRKNREELLAAIKTETVRPEDLPAFFHEAAEIGECDRLRALAIVIKTNPERARPFYGKLDPEHLASEIDACMVEPSLISLAIRLCPDSVRLDAAAMACPWTPESTLMLLSTRVSGHRLARLVNDEFGLLLSPGLARALFRNPNLTAEQKAKLEIFLTRLEKDENYRVRVENRLESLDREERAMILAEEVKEETPGEPDGQFDATDTKRHKNIYARLLRMTAAEKAIFAMRGNRDVRMLLVRDPNRMVSKAVMRNPRLTEQDITMITQMRDIDDEILRLVSLNRRWMHKYAIIRNLIFNPRTPITIALQQINRMNNTDIRIASRDRNLPTPVRQVAVRIAKQRGLR